MVALRCLYLIALVFWVGGMVALGSLAAPATFDVLEVHHGIGGRLEAGDVFAEMLRRFRFFEYGSAAVLLGCLVTLSYVRPRPAALGVRVVTVLAMLAISLYSGLGITGQIEALQLEIEANLGAWTDQLIARFDQLYTMTTVLLLINLGGGLSLIYWEARASVLTPPISPTLSAAMTVPPPEPLPVGEGVGALRPAEADAGRPTPR